jgi:protein-S-isoprenylcysteine O-methyltransferase Ste14
MEAWKRKRVMPCQGKRSPMTRLRGLLGGVIVLYFIIALEVLIMISPFAAFFYAALTPVLLFLAHWSSTRWLTAFFLPHMVMPPGLLLQAVRVAGSVLFVVGAVVFLVCAGQVYFHKLFQRGPALGSLYRWIRHPQYLALEATGLGLAILWPRFLTIVLWAVMVELYYLLARDEERRMVNQFGEQYQEYMTRTGMFLPRGIERIVQNLPFRKSPVLRSLLGFVLLMVVAVGVAFALRAYTISRLPLWSEGRITAIAILPGDSILIEHRMPDVLELPQVKSRLDQSSRPMLVYVIPENYVMQGMIADTGPQWRLYEHHQTLAMITDWIFHPFRHLQGGHLMMHHNIGGASGTSSAPGGVVRRLIFLQIESPQSGNMRAVIFGITTTRVPQFFTDVDMHNLILLDIHSLGPGTGWGLIPTPMF